MRYSGKLYGRVGRKYFDTGKTSDDWDNMEADIKFLAQRSTKASRISFGETKRDTGVSSNSIVEIAYGLASLEEQKMPGDVWDMLACERMWRKIPEHRKTGDAFTAIERARQHDFVGKSSYKAEMKNLQL